MRRSPSIVPDPDGHDIYLVLDELHYVVMRLSKEDATDEGQPQPSVS
jgi:hypothetical protein